MRKRHTKDRRMGRIEAIRDHYEPRISPDKPNFEILDWASSATQEARSRLKQFADPTGRADWQRKNLPQIAVELEELDRRRRELARTNPKDPQLRVIWKRIKPLELDLLRQTLRQVATDAQVSDLDYWDSRGAILPWCIGLGGPGFYNKVIERVEIHEEKTH